MKFVILALKIIDKTSEYVGKFASCAIILMVIIQFREVIMRYLFARPSVWGWEVATYLYGANFILAAPWALKEGRHVRTDFLFARLPKKQQVILDICTFSTIFLSFMGFMVYFVVRSAILSVSILEGSYAMSPIPIWPLKVVIAIGFTLLLLQGLAKITRDIIYLIKGEMV